MTISPSSADQSSVLSWLRPAFRKAESSAWTIVNTHGASSLRIPYSSTDSFCTLESSEILYRRLDCENDLYLAPVYKRVIHASLQNKSLGRKQAANQREKRHSLKRTQLSPGDTLSVLAIDSGQASSQITLPAHSAIEESTIVSNDSPGPLPTHPRNADLLIASHNTDDEASEFTKSHTSIQTIRKESVLFPIQEISAQDLEKLPHGPASISVQDDLAESLYMKGVRIRSLPLLSHMQKYQLDTSQSDMLKYEILRAAANADPPSIASALDKGADINCRDESSCTPLHIVLESPRGESQTAFDLLMLYQETDILAKDTNGNTPLHVATKFSPGAITKLLASGALLAYGPLKAQNLAGETPLHLAVRVAQERPEALICMLKDPHFANSVKWSDISDSQRNTALRLALRLGQQSTVTRFLETGFGIGVVSSPERQRLFDIAVQADMTDVVALLLKRTISIDHNYIEIESMLKSAIQKRAIEIVRELWKAYHEGVQGGTIDPGTNNGHPYSDILALATNTSSPEIVLLLLREGCYPDIGTSIDISETLQMALGNGDRTVVRGLLEQWKARGIRCSPQVVENGKDFVEPYLYSLSDEHYRTDPLFPAGLRRRPSAKSQPCAETSAMRARTRRTTSLRSRASLEDSTTEMLFLKDGWTF